MVRLAQFAHTFFTLATWLAIFTRSTWGARCALFTRCAFFTGYGWCFFTGFTRRTLFTWRAFFTRCTFFAGYGRGFFTGFARGTFFTRCAFFTWRTLFARLAFFVTATVAVTALLATVTTFFVARWTLGGWFLNHNRCSRLFLGGEQADQRLHQAFEQAWLRQGGRSGNRCGNFGRNRCVGAGWGSLDRSFLANQGAGRGGWLDFFHFGSGSGDFVAGLAAVGFRAVITQALHFEVRRFEVIVRQDDDTGTGAQFDLGDRVAFFVQQESCNRDRHLRAFLRQQPVSRYPKRSSRQLPGEPGCGLRQLAGLLPLQPRQQRFRSWTGRCALPGCHHASAALRSAAFRGDRSAG